MFAGLKDRLEAAATQVLGSSISSNYYIGDVVGSGGPEMLWTVFAAKKKDTKEECSVFVFYKGKNYLDLKGQDLESTVQHLRKEVQFLNKMRHPDILRVIEVIPETNKVIAFVTEPVGMSLANVRNDFRGISFRQSESNMNSNSKIQELLDTMSDFAMSEFEITSGLLNVTRAVQFLHDNKMIHSNICPENIWLTSGSSSHWKLAGFGFTKVINTSGSALSYSDASVKFEGFEHLHSAEQVPQFPISLNLPYCAPELLSPPFFYTQKADIWSLAMVACEMFSDRKILCSRLSPMVRHRLSEWHAEALSLSQLGGTLSTVINLLPDSLQDPVKEMLKVPTSSRLTAKQLLNSDFFNSGPIATIRKVQELLNSSENAAATCEFLSMLPAMLDPFPSSVLKQLVLPSLLALLRNPMMAPYALPSVLQIAKKVDEKDLKALLLPDLTRLLLEPKKKMNSGLGSGKSPEVLMELQLARHGKELTELKDDMFVQETVLLFVSRSLESPCVQVRLAILKVVSKICSEVKQRYGDDVIRRWLSTSLIERLASNCVLNEGKSNKIHESICVHALVAISALIKDKYILSEFLKTRILPTLQRIPETELRPTICMAMLSVLDESSDIVSSQTLCNHIIPLTAKLLAVKGLNLKQFDEIMGKTRGMLFLVEKSQHRTLQKSPEKVLDLNTTNIPLPTLSSANQIPISAAANKKHISQDTGPKQILQMNKTTAPQSTYDYFPKSHTDVLEMDPFSDLTAGLQTQSNSDSIRSSGGTQVMTSNLYKKNGENAHLSSMDAQSSMNGLRSNFPFLEPQRISTISPASSCAHNFSSHSNTMNLVNNQAIQGQPLNNQMMINQSSLMNTSSRQQNTHAGKLSGLSFDPLNNPSKRNSSLNNNSSTFDFLQ